MSDETLRLRAREAIRSGRIPNGRPERMWGGLGVGDCTICCVPVGELGLDLEFVREGRPATFPIHIDCFTAWESEVRTLRLVTTH